MIKDKRIKSEDLFADDTTYEESKRLNRHRRNVQKERDLDRKLKRKAKRIWS